MKHALIWGGAYLGTGVLVELYRQSNARTVNQASGGQLKNSGFQPSTLLIWPYTLFATVQSRVDVGL